MKAVNDNRFLIDCARIVQKEKPAKASMLLHKIFDGLFEDVPPNIECKVGCNWCCYNGQINTTKTEMKEMSLYMRKNFNKKMMEHIKKRALVIKKKYQKLTREERMYSRDLCPLNINRKCSVYGVRPLYCRSALSYSENACRIAHQDDPNIPVPMEAATKNMADEMTAGILLGERKKEYELTIVEGLIKEFKW